MVRGEVVALDAESELDRVVVPHPPRRERQTQEGGGGAGDEGGPAEAHAGVGQGGGMVAQSDAHPAGPWPRATLRLVILSAAKEWDEKANLPAQSHRLGCKGIQGRRPGKEIGREQA